MVVEGGDERRRTRTTINEKIKIMWTRSHASCTVKSAAPLEPMPRPGTGHVTPRTTTVNTETDECTAAAVALSQTGVRDVRRVGDLRHRRQANGWTSVIFFVSLHAISRFFSDLARRTRPSRPHPIEASVLGLFTIFFRLLLPELFTWWRLTQRRRVHYIIFIVPYIIIAQLRHY